MPRDDRVQQLVGQDHQQQEGDEDEGDLEEGGIAIDLQEKGVPAHFKARLVALFAGGTVTVTRCRR